MSSARLWLAAAALGAATLLTSGAYGVWQWNRLVVIIENALPGQEAVRDLEIEVQGDSARVAVLENGEVRSIELHPSGESDLEVRYTIGGVAHAWGGGYVEGSGGYRARLELGSGGRVSASLWNWP